MAVHCSNIPSWILLKYAFISDNVQARLFLLQSVKEGTTASYTEDMMSEHTIYTMFFIKLIQ